MFTPQVLANYLDLSPEATLALIQLIHHENLWDMQQTWKDITIDPANLNTQEELFTFIQAIGQTQWFKGHDRSQLKDTPLSPEEKQHYWHFFKQLGMTEAVSVPPEEVPQFAVILGSGVNCVRQRTASLIVDLDRGLVPTGGIVFGVGSNRELGNGIPKGEEDDIRTALAAKGMPLTEQAMVDEVVRSALAHHPVGRTLTYQSINTIGAPTRGALDCVKTADTATNLKSALDQIISDQATPSTLAVYSNQPFVNRQGRDCQSALGPRYRVIPVGMTLTEAYFMENTKSISVVVGEIARLINITYRSKPSSIMTPLTEPEQQYLATLRLLPSLQTASPAMLYWVANKDVFESACKDISVWPNTPFRLYLKAYKATMTTNNAKYNVKNTAPEQLDLLTQVQAFIDTIEPSNFEFKAAALNLKGMIERDITKDYEQAKATFRMALQDQDKLLPRTVGSILSNYGRVLSDNGEHETSYHILKTAVDQIATLGDAHETDRRCKAAIYAAFGYSCRKLGKGEACFSAFQKARSLWPDNNVIKNNAAIALSKVDDSNALLMAMGILEPDFQKAQDNHLFVNPYYLADIHIKLALFYFFEPRGLLSSAEHQKQAADCILAAKSAIENNKGYSEAYKTKAMARILKLEGDLLLIQQNPRGAEEKYTEAKTQRAQLTEAPEKKAKFEAKIPNVNAPLTQSIFYRKRQAGETKSEELSHKPGCN